MCSFISAHITLYDFQVLNFRINSSLASRFSKQRTADHHISFTKHFHYNALNNICQMKTLFTHLHDRFIILRKCKGLVRI